MKENLALWKKILVSTISGWTLTASQKILAVASLTSTANPRDFFVLTAWMFVTISNPNLDGW